MGQRADVLAAALGRDDRRRRAGRRARAAPRPVMTLAGPRQGPGALAPEFSLVVPCYNEARHLRDSVRDVVDVLEATGWTWEIVFVEDHSSDGTGAIVRELCAADRRCRAVFH